ncbi:hypothetical protein ABK040_001039 [Willaertia magna]
MSDQVYDIASRLALAVPDRSSSFVSNARSVLISKTEGATPGHYSDGWTFYNESKGKAFRVLFFPHYGQKSYEDQVNNVMPNLGQGFWSDFSVSILCQVMLNITNSVKNSLNGGNINNDVNNAMNRLRNEWYSWYGYMMFNTYDPVKSIMQEASNKRITNNQIGETYCKYMKSTPFLLATKTQLIDGYFSDWALYQHLEKMKYLGVSDNDINGVLQTFLDNGIKLPSNMTQSTWKSYVWTDNLSWTDFRSDCQSGVMAGYYTSYTGGSSYSEEGNSREFIASSQPGGKYWQSQSSCCFSGNTKVLMADLTSKPIKDIQQNDIVLCPGGKTGKVAFVSTPKRNNRTLYSIKGIEGMEFTETHPFLQSPKENNQKFITINPIKLMENVPTLSHEGISPLMKNSHILQYSISEKKELSYQVLEVNESNNKQVTNDEMLYDVIIQSENETSVSEYFVGNGGSNIWLGVSSEIPKIHIAPVAGLCVITILEEIWPFIHNLIENKKITEEKLFYTLQSNLSNLITSGLQVHQHQKQNKIALQNVTVSDSVNVNMSENLQMIVNNVFAGLTTNNSNTTVVNNTVTTRATINTANDHNEENDKLLYNQLKGAVYEIILSETGSKIMNLLNNGWRMLPSPEMKDENLNKFSIHLFSIELQQPLDYNDIQLNMIMENVDNSKEESFQLSLQKSNNNTFVSLNQMKYYDVSSISPMTMMKLKLMKDNIPLDYTATIYLPSTLPIYMYCYVDIKDKNEKTIGKMALDLRRLNDELMNEEKERKKGWNDSEKLSSSAIDICHSIAGTVSNYLTQIMNN